MLKDSEPIFVYVFINIKCIDACRLTTIKEYGGLNSTRKGKGRGQEPRKGAKPEGLSLR